MTRKVIRRQSPVKRVATSSSVPRGTQLKRTKTTSITQLTDENATKTRLVELPPRLARNVMDNLESIATVVINEIENDQMKSDVQQHINKMLERVPPVKDVKKQKQREALFQLNINQLLEQDLHAQLRKIGQLEQAHQQIKINTRMCNQDKRILESSRSMPINPLPKLNDTLKHELERQFKANNILPRSASNSFEQSANYVPENDEELAEITDKLARQLAKLEQCHRDRVMFIDTLSNAKRALLDVMNANC
ncbi:hypothetical protein BDF19DRAFT_415005 [Syncephalis fuscata]|nr:hypothetical protein BDF19DRAFT_415005 [Syncephalis fuscata]